ncbi:MAG TPA: SDR family NAD(P)-dependent oxidoreductase [Gammaproteobacteria bacterium]|jgi:NAD(P)-dependent dehydrogenase (short-subunit alcohol dehydrogenase family)|nr:SDR family NAD(P)-dependent oxidoreductase [Gammaproteobacteria bacterium]
MGYKTDYISALSAHTNISTWTVDQIPDLTGKIAVVTGANSGIGYVVTKELVKHGCKVIMACRDIDKADAAKHEIISSLAHEFAIDDNLIVRELNIADLDSIKRFKINITDEFPFISLLINNAGILDAPFKIDPKDNLEITFKTNYLGHFYLTSYLLPLLNKDPAKAARIVNVSSTDHKSGIIDYDDLQGKKKHIGRQLYYNSKLMLLIFSIELSRRLKIARMPVMSVAAHPGFASTNGKIIRSFFSTLNKTLAQTAEQGARSILYASTSPNINGGEYFGYSSFKEWSGDLQVSLAREDAYDIQNGARLWYETEIFMRRSFKIKGYEGGHLIVNSDDEEYGPLVARNRR